MEFPLEDRRRSLSGSVVPASPLAQRRFDEFVSTSVDFQDSEQCMRPRMHPSATANPYEHLIDSDSPNTSPRYDSSNSVLVTILKILKLRILYSLYLRCRGVRLQEEKKVAMHNHRGYAFLGSLIHFIPVAASLALVTTNIREVYIGGELVGKSGQDAEKLAALQFAAKLHELVMISSLTAVVLAYIRSEVLFGDGVPFGALFAGQQFRDLSFFWSQEFLATVRQELHKKTRFHYIIPLLIITTLLGVSVGPSTAQLMQPRLADWPAGGTTLWLNGIRETIFPIRLDTSTELAHCNIDTGDLACPHGGWQSLDKGYASYLSKLKPLGTVPESIMIDSPSSQRFIESRLRRSFGALPNPGPLYTDAYTRATVPISAVADSAADVGRFWAIAAYNVHREKRLWSRRDAKFSIDAIQPAVATRCLRQNPEVVDIYNQGISFPNLTSIKIVPHDANLPLADSFLNSTIAFADTAFISAVLNQVNSTAAPNLVWLDKLEEMGSTLHVVATFPPSDKSTSSNTIYACSLDSRYIDSTTSATRDRVKVVFGENHEGYLLKGIINTDRPKIHLTADWAKYLNPQTTTEVSTVFSQMASTAHLWKSIVGPDPGFNEVIVESILTVMVLNGIARASYNISMVGRAKGTDTIDPSGSLPHDFLNEFLPVRCLGPGGNAFEVSDEEKNTATMFTARVTVTGYAYSHRTATQIAAICLLLLYCLVTLLHFCYTMKTGHQSTAWDTTPELVALAINSTRTETLRNTGAGINTSAVFKEMVRVRAKDNGNLEIVFTDTMDITDSLYENKYYG